MQLNITSEKLTRLLLSANPVLANCKGSVKAVRLLLNMLGMKCITVMPHSTALANANYTNTVIPTEIHFTTNSTKLLDVDWFHADNYSTAGSWPAESSWPDNHGDWWPTDPSSTPIVDGTGCIYSETNNNAQLLCEGNGHFPGKNFLENVDQHKPTTLELYTYNTQGVIVRFIFSYSWDYIEKSDNTYEYVMYINSHPSCLSTVQKEYSNAQAIKDYDKLYKDIVENAFSTMLDRLCNVPNLQIISKNTEKLVLGTQITNTTDNIQMYITNVTDTTLQPVKSVLAKQLQEILPINMIVTADNIIGCADE